MPDCWLVKVTENEEEDDDGDDVDHGGDSDNDHDDDDDGDDATQGLIESTTKRKNMKIERTNQQKNW